MHDYETESLNYFAACADACPMIARPTNLENAYGAVEFGSPLAAEGEDRLSWGIPFPSVYPLAELELRDAG